MLRIFSICVSPEPLQDRKRSVEFGLGQNIFQYVGRQSQGQRLPGPKTQNCVWFSTGILDFPSQITVKRGKLGWTCECAKPQDRACTENINFRSYSTGQNPVMTSWVDGIRKFQQKVPGLRLGRNYLIPFGLHWAIWILIVQTKFT